MPQSQARRARDRAGRKVRWSERLLEEQAQKRAAVIEETEGEGEGSM
jgi:hypothetical protein